MAINNITSAGGAGMMILNLGTPLYVEHDRTTNVTSLSENLTRISFEGNGTFMLPDGNVSTVDSGYAFVNTMGGLTRVGGQGMIMTADGKENATLDFAEFTPINSTMGIGVGHIRTNSTEGEQLARLDNTIGVFKDEFISPTEDVVTFWKWQ
jgi:hypothetical protein